jgi:micrococcal nuclease
MGQCLQCLYQSQQPQQPQESQESQEPEPGTEYKDATYENTPEFTLAGLRRLVKILRVIDGDTVDVALCHPTGQIYRHRVRLYGIDTPEKRPPKADPNRDQEIAAALRAKAALADRFEAQGGLFLAHAHGPDKYGRLLMTFYDAAGQDINQWMITAGYAKAYDGGKKEKWKAE